VGNLEDKIPCFILVGGKSSRFKSDKSYLFYKMQYKKCKKIFKEVYFVAKKKKFKKYPFWRIDKPQNLQIIENGGWHFAYLQSPADISKKIKSFAHGEFNKPNFINQENI